MNATEALAQAEAELEAVEKMPVMWFSNGVRLDEVTDFLQAEFEKQKYWALEGIRRAQEWLACEAFELAEAAALASMDCE